MQFREWLTLTEAVQVRWVKPPPNEDPYETFGRGVQLLSEGEFRGLIDPKMQGTPPTEAKTFYDEMQKYKEFRAVANAQSESANCLAGQAFQRSMAMGKVEPQNTWDIVFKAGASDITFAKYYQEINQISISDMESRLETANKISNETTNEGQTRDMKDLAQKMLAGNDFIAPQVYRGSGNRYTFIGGKTRTLACMALNIIPSLYVVDRSAVAQTIKSLLPSYGLQTKQSTL